MIERVVIVGYRRFERLDIEPTAGLNIIVGDNEAGKSTLVEGIGLALTGRINGRSAVEEFHPYWFHRPNVDTFFKAYAEHGEARAPEILIELYLRDDDAVQRLRGVHNSAGVDAPGVRMHIAPTPEYAEEFREYMVGAPPAVVPVEFYSVEWRDFADRPLLSRPKELATAYIDARTIRSSSGVDYHTREMLSEHLDSKERTAISVAHRRARQTITDEVLTPINERIAKENAALHHRSMGLQMDQTSRASWEGGVVPHIGDVPFAMAGQGQQASLKVALAMSRTAGTSTYVLVEEPENHLSHTSLTRLLGRLEELAKDDQQLFITTHSSYVLNRLGLDRLLLLRDGRAARLTTLGDDTVAYFRKLPGYDTLRLVLAERLVLVEGPSDALFLERAIRRRLGRSPLELGIDIVSMGGLTFKRALEVCACLDRDAIALQDNDGRAEDEVVAGVAKLLDPHRRTMVVSDPDFGPTLEPQIMAVNDHAVLRRALGIADHADVATWMRNDKAEAALRLLDFDEQINLPSYIEKAVELLR